MATDIKTSEKFLAYDGDCPMCLATVGMLESLGLVRPEQLRSNHELDPGELETAQQAGIRNQLVVIDPASGEVRAGSDGLLWIVGDKPGYGALVGLLSLPGLRHLLRFGYEIVSYNRRIISPPAHQIRCDCEPEVTVGRRLTLIVPAWLFSIVAVAGYGAAAFVGWQLGTAAAGAVFMTVGCYTGWLLLATAGLVLLPGKRLDYVAHLSVTMFTGALILLPAIALMPWLARWASVAIGVLALMFCFSTMFKMQVRRVKVQQLGLPWLWGWTAAMLGAFAVCVTVYFRGQLFG